MTVFDAARLACINLSRVVTACIALFAFSVPATADVEPLVLTFVDVPATTQGAPFTFTVVPSETVTGFLAGDISVSNGTVTGFTELGATGQAAKGGEVRFGGPTMQSFRVTISPNSPGDVQFSIPASAMFSAGGMTPNEATDVVTVSFVDFPPKIDLFEAQGNFTNGRDTFTLSVIASEALQSQPGTEVQNATVVSVTVKASFTVIEYVLQPDGNGDIVFTIPAGAAKDQTGTFNATAFTHTIPLDNAGPQVIITAPSGHNGGDFGIMLMFDENAFGLDLSDLQAGLTNGTASNLAFTNGVREMTFNVTPDGASEVTFRLPAGAVFDPQNNQNTASATETIPFDIDGPVVTGVTGTQFTDGSTPFDVTVNFDEQVRYAGASRAETKSRPSAFIVTNGVINSIDPSLQAITNQFQLNITPDGSGDVTITVPENTFRDVLGNFNKAATATIPIGAPGASAEQTSAVINNFLRNRARNILSSEPDLSGRLDEKGGIGSTEPLAFSATGTEDNLQVNFSGSLTRLIDKREMNVPAADRFYGGQGKGDRLPGADALRTNVWIKGTFTHSKSAAASQDFGAVHVGADYRIHPSFLIGAMAQFDWADENDAVNGASASGFGWMFGPYAVVRLHENVILDARVAYGQSDNKVAPQNTYEDDFDTDRFLARAQISGSFAAGDWTVTPQAAVTYFREKQHAYTDSNAVFIPGQTVELGQLTFGPKMTAAFVQENGIVLKPRLGIKGVWDFKDTGAADPATGLRSGSPGNDFYARLDAGLGIAFLNGADLDFSIFADGLGIDDYEGYGGSARLRVPF